MRSCNWSASLPRCSSRRTPSPPVSPSFQWLISRSAARPLISPRLARSSEPRRAAFDLTARGEPCEGRRAVRERFRREDAMAPSRSLRIDWTKEPAPGELDRAIDGAGADQRGRHSGDRVHRARAGTARDRQARATSTFARWRSSGSDTATHPLGLNLTRRARRPQARRSERVRLRTPRNAARTPRMPYRTAQPRPTVELTVNHSIVLSYHQ